MLNFMHKGDSFSSKPSGKNLFLYQTDWSGNGQAGQFWQMESAFSFDLEFSLFPNPIYS